MPKLSPPYPEGFRRQMVGLVRMGRTPEDISREIEPCGEAFRKWVEQADLDDGRRHDGLTSEEKEELRHFRRENRQGRSGRVPRDASAGCPAARAAQVRLELHSRT